MIVSFEKRFLFVHVPKTGGTSIRAVLAKHAHSVDQLWTNRALSALGIPINYYLGGYQHYRFRVHDSIRTAARVYPPDVMAALFKFAIVRNPWDWLVSYRNFIIARPNHKRHRRVARLSFDEYIDFAIAKRVGRQSRLITDTQGNLLVDFCGRFEHLDRDFRWIAGQLQIAPRLPHSNRGRGVDYREFYSPTTRRRVQDAYAEDIERFQYSFDASERAA